MKDDDGTPMLRCHCDNGRLMIECCNGSSGCSCRGQPVDMGTCRVCDGSGWRRVDADANKNLEHIRKMAAWGGGYLGSGPRR